MKARSPLFTVEEAVRIVAGVVILAFLIAGVLVSKWWLLPAFLVGINLIQSAFTGFCLAEIFFRRCDLPQCRSTSASDD